MKPSRNHRYKVALETLRTCSAWTMPTMNELSPGTVTVSGFTNAGMWFATRRLATFLLLKGRPVPVRRPWRPITAAMVASS